MNTRSLLIAFAALLSMTALAGGDEGRPVADDVTAPVGQPLPGLTPDELALFQQGLAQFQHTFTPQEGLGPQFNAQACVTCHASPVPGGSENGTTNNVHHITINHDGQTFLAFEIGGPVRQRFSTAGMPGSTCTLAPDHDPVGVREANISVRHTPPIFGFGLLDAVSDAEIRRYEGALPFKRPGVHGAPNWGPELEGLVRLQAYSTDITRTQPAGAMRVNRFGWHASTTTLFQFSTEPFNIELGVSTPFFPRENTPDGSKLGPANHPECLLPGKQPNDMGSQISLQLFYFQAFTAAPDRAPHSEQREDGEELFERVGCADCHRPTLHTVPDYYVPLQNGTIHRVAALSGKTFHPYSDLLVHDLGEANKDFRLQGRAGGRFWRTTPLWGIRHKTRYMHDGRFTTERDAILAHGGEGQSSTDAFARLNPQQQRRLIDFLETL